MWAAQAIPQPIHDKAQFWELAAVGRYSHGIGYLMRVHITRGGQPRWMSPLGVCNALFLLRCSWAARLGA